MANLDRQPITTLPRDLIAAGYKPTTYQRAYTAILAGRVPAERGDNGRWTFAPDDLPQIAEALGLCDAVAA